MHKPGYRLYVIHKLPQLRVLDFKRIRLKVQAVGAHMGVSIHPFPQSPSIGAQGSRSLIWRQKRTGEVEGFD